MIAVGEVISDRGYGVGFCPFIDFGGKLMISSFSLNKNKMNNFSNYRQQAHFQLDNLFSNLKSVIGM